GPVEVTDPQSGRAYVLLPADVYQRVREVLDGATTGRTEAEPPSTALAGTALRVRLRELTVPPEVAQEARRYCRELGLTRGKYVRQMEDELLFQYHYGGQYVAYLRSAEGPVVVAAGNPGSEEFGRQLDALTTEERRQVTYAAPTVWDDQVSEILSPFADED